MKWRKKENSIKYYLSDLWKFSKPRKHVLRLEWTMFPRATLIYRNKVAFHPATRLDPPATIHMFLYTLFIYHVESVAVTRNSSTFFLGISQERTVLLNKYRRRWQVAIQWIAVRIKTEQVPNSSQILLASVSKSGYLWSGTNTLFIHTLSMYSYNAIWHINICIKEKLLTPFTKLSFRKEGTVS